MPTRVTLRLDFDADRRLGPGKIALLEAIGRTGSIAAAGREFGMAYRRAWLLTDELNHMFADPLVAARGGGRNGGGAVLTERGASIVAMYRDAERKVRRRVAKEIDAMERALADRSC
jgi:molybdate transport system regulatory protein